MPDLIPAAPGWYVEETDGGETGLDPVIGWTLGTDREGEPALLPFVDGGACSPPILLTAEDFQSFSRRVVYRPNHDPATDS